jgi:hypothetical protein
MPVRQDREDRQGRVGPFVTFVERVRRGGAVARWDSRRTQAPGQPVARSLRPGRYRRAAAGIGWPRRLRRASRDQGAWPRATRRRIRPSRSAR